MSARGKSFVNGYELKQALIHSWQKEQVRIASHHNISDNPPAAPKRPKIEGPDKKLSVLAGPEALIWAI